MFDLEEFYSGTSIDPEQNEANPRAVNWELLAIYGDYLLDQGHPLRQEGLQYLMQHKIRPRSGVPYSTTGEEIRYWWYYLDDEHTQPGDIEPLNLIPVQVAKLLHGTVREEGSSAGIIHYATFTEAIQDFARAWEQWKNNEHENPQARKNG